jgi:hypothetical protein
MSNRRAPGRCLVLDASIARAAGTLDSKDPIGLRCHEFLMAVRGICHRMAWNAAIKAEWDKHKSKFAATWLAVADLCNRFLTAKLLKQAAGEIGSRMFQEYKEITDLIVAAFGKTRLVDNVAADDFEQLRAQMAER